MKKEEKIASVIPGDEKSAESPEPKTADPTEEDTTKTSVPASEAEDPSTSGQKILLIEDDPLLVKMYHAKFVNEGYTVFTADNGVSGLDLALKEVPDFIILDIMMPQMSGIDLLTNLRKDPKGKNVPVIVLTNLSESEEEQKAKDLGVKEYLLKANLTPGEIVEKVKKYLTPA